MEVLKLIAKGQQDSVYNCSLNLTVFPKEWKRQRLVLISNPGKSDPTDPFSSRPLGMLDSTRTLYERMVLNQLEKAHEESGGLSD